MRGNEIIPEGSITVDQIHFWWKCMRKHSYSTKNEAMKIIAEHHDTGRLNSYHCQYCDRWHNGQISSHSSVSLSKIRRNWKNRNVKPAPETVAIYWENPKQMNRVFWDDFEKNNV